MPNGRERHPSISRQPQISSAQRSGPSSEGGFRETNKNFSEKLSQEQSITRGFCLLRVHDLRLIRGPAQHPARAHCHTGAEGVLFFCSIPCGHVGVFTRSTP